VKIKRENLLEIMSRANLEPDALREDYPGRGSFGKGWIGIDADGVGQLIAFFAAAGEVYADLFAETEGGHDREHDDDPADYPEFEASDLAKGVVVDSMGLGIIFYWPDLNITED
jgi:hypothetical protein